MAELFGLAALAVVAGVISFASPCTVPLVPGYVAYVSGLRGSDGHPQLRTALAGSALFVGGFTVVFAAFGATASALGWWLASRGILLERIAGAVVIVMGLALAGILRWPMLARSVQLDPTRLSRGLAGAFPLGMAFGAGWTPCIGPVLAGVLAIAATEATLGRGVFLLAFYSLGLGVPFLGVAYAVARGYDRFAWLRRRSPTIQRLGGWLLVAIGVSMVTGIWAQLMSGALSWFARLGWPPI